MGLARLVPTIYFFQADRAERLCNKRGTGQLPPPACVEAFVFGMLWKAFILDGNRRNERRIR